VYRGQDIENSYIHTFKDEKSYGNRLSWNNNNTMSSKRLVSSNKTAVKKRFSFGKADPPMAVKLPWGIPNERPQNPKLPRRIPASEEEMIVDVVPLIDATTEVQFSKSLVEFRRILQLCNIFRASSKAMKLKRWIVPQPSSRCR
jgi:hypothetical protein